MKLDKLKALVKKYSNTHCPGSKKSIMVFSTPRSGSTWLMELIWSQPGFKYCNEPLNLRNPLVVKNSGVNSWCQLYDPVFTKQLFKYFEKINKGEIRDLNPNPFNKFYRYKTDRIVFKILHGMEDKVVLLTEYCDTVPLLLIRHPIAVSVSREVLPRMECHFKNDFSANIPADILKRARQIVDSGTFLQKAVVCWCFENYYQLKEVSARKYMGITYEEMVLNPKAAVSRLAPYLDLGDEKVILENLAKPSKTTGKSDLQTQKIISENYSAELILNKWKNKVSEKDIKNSQDILDLFEIDIYRANEAVPLRYF